MTHSSWHYDIEPSPDCVMRFEPIAGTYAGEGIETRERAIADIARQHGVSPDRVKVRKAGEAW